MTEILGKTVVILISGKAGVGKTTIANILLHILVEKYNNTYICSFAQKLKIIAKNMGWDGTKDEKGRKLLQDLGKVGRDYDKDMWVKSALYTIGVDDEFVLIDDWRFPNEFDFLSRINSLKVFKIRIYAPEREILKDESAQDISETSLPEIDPENPELASSFYDYIIGNEGDMDILKENCKVIVENIYNSIKNLEWR